MSTKNNNAKSIAIVGQTGTGKNFCLENEILAKMPNIKKYIADVNNEYNIPFFGIDDFMRKLIKTEIKNINGEKIENKIVLAKNSLIIFDEATNFFDSHRSEDVVHLLVGKRHDNNFIVFLFHSLADLPPYIKRKLDFIFLKKTGDDEKTVVNKFGKDSKIHRAFNELKNSQNYYETKVLKLI